MSDNKRIAAIVRGPKGYFGTNGVLYKAGQLVPENPGVPEEDVSPDAFRMKEVEYESRNGDLLKKKVKVRVPFRPASDDKAASSPKEAGGGLNDGQFNVSSFLKKNTGDIEAAIGSGKVDAYLDVIEQGEAAKGSPRAKVNKAIVARREGLSN